MMADLIKDKNDNEYQEKVAKCFEMRVDKMKKLQNTQNKKWQSVMNKE